MAGFNIMTFKQEALDMMNSISREVNEVTGLQVKYIVRDEINVDTVFNDVTSSSFTTFYNTVMVVKFSDTNVQEADFLTKFGITAQDTTTYEINISKWKEDIPSLPSPREGDLLFIDGDNRLWEITYVDEEHSLHDFYHLTYTISAQVFEYNQETMDLNTGVDTIDDFAEIRTYSIDITLGSGSGTYAKDEVVYQGLNLTEATARAIVVGWNEESKILRINDVVGSFVANQLVIGNQTDAAYLLGTTVTLSTPTSEAVLYSNDTTADNQTLEYEADQIIDWSESDPFSDNDY